MPRALAAALAILLIPSGLTAAESKGLSIDVALKLRSAADVAMSPDAATVVYRVDRRRAGDEPRGGNVGELWSVSTAGGEPIRIADAGFDARTPRWSPDGKYLAWLATTDDKLGPQIHVRPAAGGGVERVTHAAGGVSALAWSPDSTRIAFTSMDASTAEQDRARSEGRDWVLFGATGAQLRLYCVDVASRRTALVSHAELSVHFFDWSPDGARLAIGAAPSVSDDDHELAIQPYIVDAKGGEPRRIVAHRGRLTHVTWSGDGKWVAWLASTQPSDPWGGALFVAPSDATAAPRNLIPDLSGTPTWLGSLPGQPGKLAMMIEEGQVRVLRTVDLAMGRMEPYSVSSGVLIGAPAFSGDGRTFAAAASSPNHPAEVCTGSQAKPSALRCFNQLNPQLRDVALGAQEVTRWRSKDGLWIEGVLVKPVGFKLGVRYPVVVHVHGGSEGIAVNGWLGSYIDWGQLLAAKGYVVIYPNYRGSRGRGVDFVRGNRGDLMGREWEDIESALDHVIDLGIGDSQRAGIYGFSWGGYAAGWAATYGTARFKAAVAGAGIFNWISEAGTNDTRMHEQVAHWDAPLYENFLHYLQRSPIYETRRANTPLLMLHGEEDPSCPISQAIEMHTALKWKGVPVELAIYPREGHGMREAAHQEDFLRRGLGWLDRYLKSP